METQLPPDIRQSVEDERNKFDPIELTSLEDMTDFWLTFRKNNGLTIKDTEKELRMAHLQALETLEKIKAGNEIFYGVKKDGKIIATGLLHLIPERTSIRKESNHSWYAYLGLLTVNPEYRGKSIAKKLTEVRMERAKQEGAAGVTTHVFASNPRALATKFDDGFYVDHLNIQDDELIGFNLKKDFKESYFSPDPKKGHLRELKEVNLSNHQSIREDEENGWRGIDIKNLGDAKDNDPTKWNLILEKEF